MTAESPYRGALSRSTAIGELKTNAGSPFDPRLVDLFLEVLREENPLSTDQEELATLL